MSDTLKIVSRNSKLAIIQSNEIIKTFANTSFELNTFLSFGDKRKDISLLENPPEDIFTRELDEKILSGEADLAIHSAKDLPFPLANGLTIIALTKAFDETDALISKENLPLAALPSGARVGTSSPTRRQELLVYRPDLKVVSIRGTIEERIALVDEDHIDALIVASCALKRLGLFHRAAEVLPFKTHPLQGSLAVVARTDRRDLQKMFAAIDARNSYGSVTLVGFGPGHPDLLTIRGEKALQKADIIFYDDLLDSSFLTAYKAEKVYVGKRKDKHSASQDDIQRMLLNAARAGIKVVRLKGGDPMVFAHGGEEIVYLKSNYIKVEVVPGVSTGIAVASLTKIPLTHRGLASSVSFITGHSPDIHLPDTDTVVIYMGGSNIQKIAQNAIHQGRKPETEVMLVYNVSREDEKTYFTTLQALSEDYQAFPTPLIIVVGEVVALKKYISNNRQPKILITGTDKEDFERSGNVIHQPLIEINRTKEVGLQEIISHLQQFDWLFFTSRYSVRYFFEALKSAGKDSRFLHHLRIASVGRVTSKALNNLGITPDLQPEEESSDGLLQTIRELNIQPGKVFIPRSDKGLPVLPEGLTAMGWKVETFAIYKNQMPQNLIALDLKDIDKIVFSSPSCVTNFLKLYGAFPEDKEYIFRGKETEKRFKELHTSNYK